jgi:hypothetical protein
VLLATAVIFYVRRSFTAWRLSDPDRRSTKFARMASTVIAILAFASVSDYPLRTPTMMCVMVLLVLWLKEPGRDSFQRAAPNHRSEETEG